ncbi:aspartate/glutamate racemase family protein [Olleya sp. 1-3]|uniref:aspartate/glutamate racemase family protein n=1 Tax=Olleya sp. 1-3 TaxID=2058323 RepID=UPI000C32CAA9|nr:aspartate/glutamate racemase family protein [Olleya sp. 1-3]PKG52763.1 hypothetical protein CXF54_03040 [Olleya sp. 1-3]
MIKKQSEVLGILGLGSRSTLFYLEQLNTQFHTLKGDYHTFPSITHTVDFNTINPYLPNQFNTLKPVVKQQITSLFKDNVHSCIVPNITLHETIDQLQFDKPILHPITLSTQHLKAQNISNVIVFGSLYTMSSDYITNQLRSENITVTLPSKSDQITIDNCRKKLYSYSETDIDFEEYKALIEKYSKNNIVLVACTELSLWTIALNNKNIVDMALLQINKAIERTRQ